MKWPVSSVLLPLLLMVGAVGCSPSSPTPVVPPVTDPPVTDPPIVNPPPGTTIPLPTLKVDPSVKPSFPSLPDSDGGPRPVSSVTDAKGYQGDFVQNKLIVTTRDSAKLEALLTRYKGKLLRTLKPEGTSIMSPSSCDSSGEITRSLPCIVAITARWPTILNRSSVVSRVPASQGASSAVMKGSPTRVLYDIGGIRPRCQREGTDAPIGYPRGGAPPRVLISLH